MARCTRLDWLFIVGTVLLVPLALLMLRFEDKGRPEGQGTVYQIRSDFGPGFVAGRLSHQHPHRVRNTTIPISR